MKNKKGNEEKSRSQSRKISPSPSRGTLREEKPKQEWVDKSKELRQFMEAQIIGS
jgi:hypothetical protein